MIITTLMLETTPLTVPTVCIKLTGSFDVDAIDRMKTKNPYANMRRTTPTITIRMFRWRIGTSR